MGDWWNDDKCSLNSWMMLSQQEIMAAPTKEGLLIITYSCWTGEAFMTYTLLNQMDAFFLSTFITWF